MVDKVVVRLLGAIGSTGSPGGDPLKLVLSSPETELETKHMDETGATVLLPWSAAVASR